MAKVKYDASDVEPMASGTPAPVGTYRMKIREVDGPKDSSSGNPMLEVMFDITHDASGKDLTGEGFMPLWYYPIIEHDHPFVKARWLEFLMAFGLKKKGTMDTDALVGQSCIGKLKSDKDLDGDYRPKISKLMALPEESEPEGEPETDDELAEPEEAVEPAELEMEEQEEEEETVNLKDLDRSELKKLIKEEELDVKVFKSMSDDDIRAAIAEAVKEEVAEDDEEEEEEEDVSSDGAVNYTSWAIEDLKKELKQRELSSNGPKKALVARLRKDDGESPF